MEKGFKEDGGEDYSEQSPAYKVEKGNKEDDGGDYSEQFPVPLPSL